MPGPHVGVNESPGLSFQPFGIEFDEFAMSHGERRDPGVGAIKREHAINRRVAVFGHGVYDFSERHGRRHGLPRPLRQADKQRGDRQRTRRRQPADSLWMPGPPQYDGENNQACHKRPENRRRDSPVDHLVADLFAQERPQIVDRECTALIARFQFRGQLRKRKQVNGQIRQGDISRGRILWSSRPMPGPAGERRKQNFSAAHLPRERRRPAVDGVDNLVGIRSQNPNELDRILEVARGGIRAFAFRG